MKRWHFCLLFSSPNNQPESQMSFHPLNHRPMQNAANQTAWFLCLEFWVLVQSFPLAHGYLSFFSICRLPGWWQMPTVAPQVQAELSLSLKCCNHNWTLSVFPPLKGPLQKEPWLRIQEEGTPPDSDTIPTSTVSQRANRTPSRCSKRLNHISLDFL